VPAYEKPVDTLAALMASDFSLDEEGFLQAYDITARRLKNAAIRVINSGGKYSLAEREPAVRAYRMAETALTRVAELESRFGVSIATLRKANGELATIVKKREYGRKDIKDYAKQIRELADAYQVLAR
jgi:phage-related tail protein